jgi:hypothetical protein
LRHADRLAQFSLREVGVLASLKKPLTKVGSHRFLIVAAKLSDISVDVKAEYR